MLLEEDTLASSVGDALVARGARVAVAETTAGGLISARLLSVAGASAWFDRGSVCYGGRSKQETTGIDTEILRTHGAVSVEAVSAMAEGIRATAGVAFGVAESGIAGPAGSRRSPKPVGTVVIAVAGPAGTTCEEHTFVGTRVQFMAQIAEHALRMLAQAVATADGS
ncbi:MAG: CinA family protein [Dehalococcoidia bacterium]